MGKPNEIIYLCGPIDDGTIFNDYMQQFTQKGYFARSPGALSDYNHVPEENRRRVRMRWAINQLSRSDVLVMLILGNQITSDMEFEIGVANELEMPIFSIAAFWDRSNA